MFYKKLISAVPLKNVTSRFAMEKIKSVTALPVPAALSGAPGVALGCHRPARPGDPVFQRRSVIRSASAAAYWITRVRRGDDDGCLRTSAAPSNLLIVLADLGMRAQHRDPSPRTCRACAAR